MIRFEASAGGLRTLFEEYGGAAYGYGARIRLPLLTISPTVGIHRSWYTNRDKKKNYLSPSVGIEFSVSNIILGFAVSSPLRKDASGNWKAKKGTYTNMLTNETKDDSTILIPVFYGIIQTS